MGGVHDEYTRYDVMRNDTQVHVLRSHHKKDGQVKDGTRVMYLVPNVTANTDWQLTDYVDYINHNDIDMTTSRDLDRDHMAANIEADAMLSNVKSHTVKSISKADLQA